MSSQKTLVDASLSDLISSCCQEQNRLTPAQGSCFELFQRAIELGDDLAWFAVVQQFRSLFVRWVYETFHGVLDHFVVEDLLQTALERFPALARSSASAKPYPAAVGVTAVPPTSLTRILQILAQVFVGIRPFPTLSATDYTDWVQPLPC